MKIYVKNLVTVLMENLLSIDDNQHVKSISLIVLNIILMLIELFLKNFHL